MPSIDNQFASDYNRAALGRAMLAEWLSKTDTDNPINDLAVIEVDRALKLGDVLDVQKNFVKDKTDTLKRNNLLSQNILDFRGNDTDNQRKLGQLPGEVVGTADNPGKDDAKVLARANDFIDRMHAIGLALDLPAKDASGKQNKFTSIDELKVIPRTTFDDWSTQIQTRTDAITATSQQDQANLQSLLSMVNRAIEVATAAIKKNADEQALIIRNVNVKG